MLTFSALGSISSTTCLFLTVNCCTHVSVSIGFSLIAVPCTSRSPDEPRFYHFGLYSPTFLERSATTLEELHNVDLRRSLFCGVCVNAGGTSEFRVFVLDAKEYGLQVSTHCTHLKLLAPKPSLALSD